MSTVGEFPAVARIQTSAYRSSAAQKSPQGGHPLWAFEQVALSSRDEANCSDSISEATVPQ